MTRRLVAKLRCVRDTTEGCLVLSSRYLHDAQTHTKARKALVRAHDGWTDNESHTGCQRKGSLSPSPTSAPGADPATETRAQRGHYALIYPLYQRKTQFSPQILTDAEKAPEIRVVPLRRHVTTPHDHVAP
eukprot:4774350-Pyramimonas_sp.AAC.2